MTGPLDTGLDFFRTVLDLRGYRQQILSADIANASTPQFKAVDLDFKEALANSLTGGGSTTPDAQPARLWLVSDPRHMAPQDAGVPLGAGTASASASVKYQVGQPVTLDGNSVDLNGEKMQAAENAVDYQAAATFTSETVNMLMTAIKGSSGSNGNGG